MTDARILDVDSNQKSKIKNQKSARRAAWQPATAHTYLLSDLKMQFGCQLRIAE